jgi:hypothetical protein
MKDLFIYLYNYMIFFNSYRFKGHFSHFINVRVLYFIHKGTFGINYKKL